MNPSKLTDEELKKLTAAADGGDTEAQYKLGDYFFGLSINVRDGKLKYGEKAFQYLTAAAQKKHGKATLALAPCYVNGIGTQTDTEKGLECLNTAVELGETEALLDLGETYTHGYFTHKNLNLAQTYLREAISKGNIRAYKYLGEAFSEAKDYKQAFTQYLTGAEKGDEDAYYSVALQYSYGLGIKFDIEQAAFWYGKGAEKMDISCMVQLAGILCHGSLKKDLTDEERAFKLYKQALLLDWEGSYEEDGGENLIDEYGDPPVYWRVIISALYELLEKDKTRKTRENAEFVSLWFNRGVKANLAVAQYALAKYYVEGDFLPQNYDEAYRLIQDAFIKYDVSEEDEKYAVLMAEARELSPEQKSDAYLVLYDLLQKGYGTDEDRLNAKKGEHNVFNLLFKNGENCFKGNDTQKDFEKAFYYLTKFTDLTDKIDGYAEIRVQAYKMLTVMYGKGKGTKKDKIKASQYNLYAKEEKKKAK